MTFLGPSDHFSLGSKWFWYFQNDKMYTLGPTERPSGVRKGPGRAKNGPQTLLGPFGPILVYFLGAGQARNFSVLLGQKKANFFFFKIFFHYFDSQRVWDPQNPKIDPVDPPVDPILAHFVCKKAKFGVKKKTTFF